MQQKSYLVLSFVLIKIPCIVEIYSWNLFVVYLEMLHKFTDSFGVNSPE